MLAFGKAECEQNVIAFDIACLLQALTKCAQTLRERCSSAKKPNHRHRRLLRPRRERPRRRAAEQRDELAPSHVWMAPAWQEITSRAAQKSLAVMCPACSRSPDGLLALMGCANRGLITRTGSMSRSNGRLLSVASERPTVPSRVIALSQAPTPRPREQGCRDVKAERAGGLQVDD